MNGIEFVFNNQTVLILVLLVKTVCGIDLLSFNKILQCMQIPLLLIVCSPDVKKCLMGHLTDISWMSHWFLGFAFMIHHTIGHGMMCGDVMTNCFTFSCESPWDVTKSVAFLELC